jgi:ABC-type phosphate/phosphonate transport system, ATPase component
LFELKGVNIYYNGRAVLKDVSFRIEPGERVALVGRSGAGKTTLLKLLYAQQKSRAALIPQELGLVKTLSVFHNIYIGCLNRHATCYNLLNLIHPMRCEVERVRPLVAKLGLEEKLFTLIEELSGGQQQRTAVGRALYQEGDVLLGDEPVSAIDPHRAHCVLDAINERHDTVVLAMHDVALALAYTTRVIGLKNGRVVMDQPAAGLKPLDLDLLYQS